MTVARAALAAVWFLAACGDSKAPGDAGPDAGAELPACSLASTMTEIQQKILDGPKCSACHGGRTLFPTTLDLRADGLADRVVDKPAESDPFKGKCAGRILIPRASPLTGIFIEKVEKAMPSCGDPMPQGMPTLSPDEISCIKRWAVLAAQGR